MQNIALRDGFAGKEKINYYKRLYQLHIRVLDLREALAKNQIIGFIMERCRVLRRFNSTNIKIKTTNFNRNKAGVFTYPRLSGYGKCLMATFSGFVRFLEIGLILYISDLTQAV